MTPTREFLLECAVRGYFVLKAAFLRLDLVIAGGLPPAFDAVFVVYVRNCAIHGRFVCGRMSTIARVEHLAGQALCQVAGLARNGGRT